MNTSAAEAMNKIVVDQAMRSKLNGLDKQIEFLDESGKTLGHFLPSETYRELLVAWSKAWVSDEELERRRKEPGGRTLKEIWQRLGRT
jgi:hypothetical protein